MHHFASNVIVLHTISRLLEIHTILLFMMEPTEYRATSAASSQDDVDSSPCRKLDGIEPTELESPNLSTLDASVPFASLPQKQRMQLMRLKLPQKYSSSSSSSSATSSSNSNSSVFAVAGYGGDENSESSTSQVAMSRRRLRLRKAEHRIHVSQYFSDVTCSESDESKTATTKEDFDHDSSSRDTFDLVNLKSEVIQRRQAKLRQLTINQRLSSNHEHHNSANSQPTPGESNHVASTLVSKVDCTDTTTEEEDTSTSSYSEFAHTSGGVASHIDDDDDDDDEEEGDENGFEHHEAMGFTDVVTHEEVQSNIETCDSIADHGNYQSGCISYGQVHNEGGTKGPDQTFAREFGTRATLTITELDEEGSGDEKQQSEERVHPFKSDMMQEGTGVQQTLFQVQVREHIFSSIQALDVNHQASAADFNIESGMVPSKNSSLTKALSPILSLLHQLPASGSGLLLPTDSTTEAKSTVSAIDLEAHDNEMPSTSTHSSFVDDNVELAIPDGSITEKGSVKADHSWKRKSVVLGVVAFSLLAVLIIVLAVKLALKR